MLFEVGTYDWQGDLEDRGSDWTLSECGHLVHEDVAHELIAELEQLEIGQSFMFSGIEIVRTR
tara:strand:- start:1513 stop:1701 length:189 start_codon:yes stop_codon:yes gene_type:complete